MNGLGDMVRCTGYPVMVVVIVVITTIDVAAVRVMREENMLCCGCIYFNEVISLGVTFQKFSGNNSGLISANDVNDGNVLKHK